MTYRSALNMFVFTGLWLVIGLVVMWSPVPGALGIAGAFFVTWLFLFFAVLAGAGASLTLAAINGAFPATPARPRSSAAATPVPPATQSRRSTIWAPDPSAAGAGSSSSARATAAQPRRARPAPPRER